MQLTRRLRTALLTLLLVAGTAGPALAETVRSQDARHDVTRYDDQHPDGVVLPHRANLDIRRHRVTYGSHRVKAVIQFAEIRHRARMTWVGVPIQWRQPGGDRGYGDLELTIRAAGPAQGHVQFGSSDAQCRTRGHVDYRTDRVELSMPAGCLGAPRAIWAYSAAYLTRRKRAVIDTLPDEADGRRGIRIERGS